MHPSFKYFGKQADPDRKFIFSGQAMSQVEFAATELTVFRSVYTEQVTKAIRESGRLFSDSMYCNLSSQLGAFARLEETLTSSKFELVEITASSHEKEEAVFRVQTRIPVLASYYKQLFTEPMPAGAKGYVLVSFYVGLAKEFLRLSKKDELIELLEQAIRSAKNEPITPVNDPAFDPDRVIPNLLKGMRLDRRYDYMALQDGDWVSPKRFYQSPEGFIYHVEIDGYSALAP